jgi:hypothetical protein
MPIVYRTDGAWGAGQGSNLSAAQVDGNFYDIDIRVTAIEDNPVPPIAPISMTLTGTSFSMGLSNGTTLGPIQLTMPLPNWRGNWTASTDYDAMDFFTAPDGGFGAVIKDHTSASSFDWAASGGSPASALYKKIVAASGVTIAFDELTDVGITSVGNDHFVLYDATAEAWSNRSPADVTAVLVTFEGDSGSGGEQGLVPAPAAGDASAGKFLSASGEWEIPVGGGGSPALGATALAGLTDVSISGPANGSLLQFQASDGKWHAATLSSVGGTVTQVATGSGLSGGPITTTGTISLASIASLTVLANTTGGTAAPAAVSLSLLLDAATGSSRGSILRRGAAGWTVLTPGTAGQYLKSGGAGADVAWDSPAGSGTVTEVATGTGLIGGPITTTGTIALDSIADDRILANISGGSAAPTANTLTAILDAILGSTRGMVLYRGSSSWGALAPGQNGWFLQTKGISADPVWAKVNSGGSGGTTGTTTSIWGLGCDYATTTALPACTYANGTAGVGATLTGNANGALSVDGSTPSIADRILVKDQASLAQNGVYAVTTVGSGGAAFVLTRATDYDEPAETVQGSAFAVSGGTANADTAWVLITGGSVTVGTTSLEFEALTATLPDLTAGQILGNSNSFTSPAAPTTISAIFDRAIGSTRGSIVTRGASAWDDLTPGTSGKVLTSNGAGADLSWEDLGDAVVGPASAGDNEIVLFDGTTGKLVKTSGTTIADVIVSGDLGTGVETWLVTPSSANLAAAVTGETGSGALVFATSPTLVTPALGTPASGALTNCTSIPVAQATGVLPAANGGAGTVNGILKANGSGTVSAATAGTDYATVTQAKTEYIQVAVSDETTALTTGTAKITFRMPFAMTLTDVRASLSTTSASGGPVTVDINEAGSTILSTKLTIDDGEKTSTTAASAAVISDSSLADDAEITIDIDDEGSGAKGLKVTLIGTRA